MGGRNRAGRPRLSRLCSRTAPRQYRGGDREQLLAAGSCCCPVKEVVVAAKNIVVAAAAALTGCQRDLAVGQPLPQLQGALRVHQQGHHVHKLEGGAGRKKRVGGCRSGGLAAAALDAHTSYGRSASLQSKLQQLASCRSNPPHPTPHHTSPPASLIAPPPPSAPPPRRLRHGRAGAQAAVRRGATCPAEHVEGGPARAKKRVGRQAGSRRWARLQPAARLTRRRQPAWCAGSSPRCQSAQHPAPPTARVGVGRAETNLGAGAGAAWRSAAGRTPSLGVMSAAQGGPATQGSTAASPGSAP